MVVGINQVSVRSQRLVHRVNLHPALGESFEQADGKSVIGKAVKE